MEYYLGIKGNEVLKNEYRRKDGVCLHTEERGKHYAKSKNPITKATGYVVVLTCNVQSREIFGDRKQICGCLGLEGAERQGYANSGAWGFFSR